MRVKKDEKTALTQAEEPILKFLISKTYLIIHPKMRENNSCPKG